MPTAWSTYPIKFEGGWRTDLGRLEHGIQAPGSARVLQNYEPSIQGGYAKVLGHEKYSTSVVPGSGDITGVVVADAERCIARRGSKYYLSSGAAWTEKATAPNTGTVRVRHQHYNFNGTEKIVMVDSLNYPAFYNSGTQEISYDVDAVDDVLGASIVVLFKNHLFFAKNNNLIFTAPYQDTNYSTGSGAGIINVGSPITGLSVFREQLIIFSLDRIQRLAGNTSTDFVLQSVADNTGCLCPNTVKEVGGDIMYLGPDGVRYLSATERNNDFGLERASKNIQSELVKLVNTNSPNSPSGSTSPVWGSMISG